MNKKKNGINSSQEWLKRKKKEKIEKERPGWSLGGGNLTSVRREKKNAKEEMNERPMFKNE